MDLVVFWPVTVALNTMTLKATLWRRSREDSLGLVGHRLSIGPLMLTLGSQTGNWWEGGVLQCERSSSLWGVGEGVTPFIGQLCSVSSQIFSFNMLVFI